jgi:hypothetical protein
MECLVYAKLELVVVFLAKMIVIAFQIMTYAHILPVHAQKTHAQVQIARAMSNMVVNCQTEEHVLLMIV